MKWLMGSSDNGAQAPAGSVSTVQNGAATPPSSSQALPSAQTPPANQARVMFVQKPANEVESPASMLPTPPASTPSLPPMPTTAPSSPLPTPPANPAPVTPPQVAPVETAPQTPVLPPKAAEPFTVERDAALEHKDDKPVEVITPKEEPKSEEKTGVIVMSDQMASESSDEGLQHVSNMFEEALEATANDKPEPVAKPVEVPVKEEPAPSYFAQQAVTPTFSFSPPPKGSQPDPDLPDVSADIKRILQERWITLANQQMEDLAKRRDATLNLLAELEIQQRELATKKLNLERERDDIAHSSESWSAKLKEAQTTVDKIMQEVSSIQ